MKIEKVRKRKTDKGRGDTKGRERKIEKDRGKERQMDKIR